MDEPRDTLELLTALRLADVDEYRQVIEIGEQSFGSVVSGIEYRLKTSLTSGHLTDETESVLREFQHYERTLPNRFRMAVFIALYGLLEDAVAEIIDAVVEDCHTVKLEDLNGKGLLRATKYLSKVSRVAIPCGLLGTPELNLLNMVRNICAHCQGAVEPGKEKQLCGLIQENQKYGDNLLILDGYIHLEREFNHEVCSAVEDCIARLNTALRAADYY